MEQGRLSEYACTVCHIGPAPTDLASVSSRYRSLDDFRPEPASVKMSFSGNYIPDTTGQGRIGREVPIAIRGCAVWVTSMGPDHLAVDQARIVYRINDETGYGTDHGVTDRRHIRVIRVMITAAANQVGGEEPGRQDR